MPAILAALRLPNLVAFALVLGAACWTTGGPLRRASGVAMGVAALVPSWFLPEGYLLVRGLSGLAAFACIMRVTDLRNGRWTLGERLLHVASFVDTRRLVRAPPRLEARVVGVGLLWLSAAVAGYLWLDAGGPHGALSFWLARWSAALIVAYGGVSAGYALIRATYAAIGFQTGPLHAAPVMSRTVDEFWGDRWARPVSTWLRETFFRPWVRRRRPVLGGLLAFGVSGAFHAYCIWVALGFAAGGAMALSMLAFFMVQAVAVALERALGARRWPPWKGRVWTLGFTLVSAPLFLEPMARVLGEAVPAHG